MVSPFVQQANVGFAVPLHPQGGSPNTVTSGDAASNMQQAARDGEQVLR
jgi:hypothetical protein